MPPTAELRLSLTDIKAFEHLLMMLCPDCKKVWRQAVEATKAQESEGPDATH